MKIIYTIFAVVLLSGCASHMREAREVEARNVYQRQTVESELAMLKERLKGIEAAQEQLLRDIRDIRELAARSDVRSGEVAGRIDRAVRALEERDLTLQKETISTISARVAELMKSQAASVRPSSSVSGTGVEHVVQTGENLSAIAQAYGVTVAAIVKANNLANPNAVRVGQKLFIPR